ncbi:hypothetical protein BVY03_03305 [bacterium K02(2017)]|nr:hypothetical protein BVY03_03305 [bacterium K02(2017)]
MSDDSWPIFGKVHSLVFDFDGVFTNNKVLVSESGVESVQCDRRDGLGIKILRELKQKKIFNGEIFVLSTEINKVVEQRCKKLKLDCFQNIGDKLDFLQKRFSKLNLEFDGLIYLGNDLNDWSVFKTDCFSVAPQDAHVEIQKIANRVLPEKGGEGFVRAFIEEWVINNGVNLEDYF